jgi:hypothetical protein
MSATTQTKKNRYEVIHVGLHGSDWIAVIWDRREKRIAGSSVGRNLDEVVAACVDIIRSL